jgi:MFS family permease
MADAMQSTPNAFEARTDWLAVAAAVAATWAPLMPVFGIASVADHIRQALHMDTVSFGLCLSIFFATTAVCSTWSARVARAYPAPWIFALTSIAAVMLMAVISGVKSAGELMAALVLAGINNAMVQPAAGLLVRQMVQPSRLSLATGLLGAALGAAPLLPGGVAFFVLGGGGWQSAIGIDAAAVALAIPVSMLARTRRVGPSSTKPALQGVWTSKRVSTVLNLWGLAALAGTIGVSTTAMFFVSIGASSGLTQATTALLYTAAGLIAPIVRVIVGALGDRRPQYNPYVVAAMMLFGGAGLWIMSYTNPLDFAAGALLAVAGGWGWTGLLLDCALRIAGANAAAASATMQMGLFAGTALGPFSVGALAGAIGLGRSLETVALLAVAGAMIMVAGTILRCRDPARDRA